MRKKLILIIVLALLITLSACGVQQMVNSPRISTPLPTVQSTPKPSAKYQIEITPEYIKQLLNTRRSDIQKTFNIDFIQDGTVAIIESNLVFPIIYIDELGLELIFGNNFNDLEPMYIVIDRETNVKSINIRGAKPGMTFNEIKSILGEAEIKETWFANEARTRNKFSYVFDDVEYIFVSLSKESYTGSELYIRRADRNVT